MIKKHKVRYVFATLIIIIALQHMFCMPNRGFVAKNFWKANIVYWYNYIYNVLILCFFAWEYSNKKAHKIQQANVVLGKSYNAS